MPELNQFQCSGSIDALVVKQAFDRLSWRWQSIDQSKCERVLHARTELGAPITIDVNAQRIQSPWARANGSVICQHSPQSLHKLRTQTLSIEQFCPFLRSVESLCIEQQRHAPILVYWSSQSASRFLPTEEDSDALIRAILRPSTFSECAAEPDAWHVLIESTYLCMVVYGQQCNSKGGDHSEVGYYSDGGDSDDALVPRRPFPYHGGSEVKRTEPEDA